MTMYPHDRLSGESLKHLPDAYWAVIKSPRLFPDDAAETKRKSAPSGPLPPLTVAVAVFMVLVLAAVIVG